MSTTLNRSETSWRLIAQAEEALALGDMEQAVENGWDAAALSMKSIAGERGWEHDCVADLYAVADRLVAETGNRDVRRMFLVAAATIHNFDEGWLTEQTLSGNLADIRTLLDILDNLSSETN